MVSVAPEHMFAFALSTDHALYWKYHHRGAETAWTAWLRAGGTWTHEPVIGSRGLGEAHIFMVDTNNALQQANYNFMKDDDFSPWKILGGKLSGPPAVTNRNGTIHIFHVGVDHLLHHKSWDGTKYTPQDGYEKLGGAFIHSPAAVSAGANEVSVFAVGLGDGYLHHYHWKSSSGWDPARKLPGRWASTPSAISIKEGSWDVFGVDPEGKINHISSHNGKISNLETIPGHFQTIDAISSTPGRIDLVGWGKDGGVYYKVWDQKSRGEWENLHGGIAHRPTPVSDGPGILNIVAVGTNTVMYINARDPKTGKWSGWVNIEGIVISRVGGR